MTFVKGGEPWNKGKKEIAEYYQNKKKKHDKLGWVQVSL
jgi:hypothetical protein